MRCRVELDVFSGMPNPSWTLTEAESEWFLEQLSTLPRTSPRELAGNLGYRGFVVECENDVEAQRARVQDGVVELASGATATYASDEDRKLERWLLGTGRPHLQAELLELVERDLP